MRSFKTFLAEVNLGQIADLKPSTQSRRGRLAQKPPSLRRQADDPRQQLSRKRQLELGINLPSGKAIPAPGPELLVPGGLATAPTRAALRGGLKAANAIRTMPFKQIDKITRLGKLRSASRGLVPGSQTLTGGGVLAAGVNKSLNVYTDEVNKFLASQGYNTGPRTPAGSRRYKRRSDALSLDDVLSATKKAGLSGKEWTGLLGSEEASQGYLIPAVEQGIITAFNPSFTVGTESTPQTSKASYDVRKRIGKGITSALTKLGLINKPKSVFDSNGSDLSFSALEKLQKSWVREIENKKSRRFKNIPTQTTPTTNDLGLDFSDF